MAIIVEQEGKNGIRGLAGIGVWLLVLILIGTAVYYIFFKRPDLVGSLTPPVEFARTAEISRINLTTEDIIGNPAFQELKAYIPPLVSAPEGKANPFE